jgi:hypothetical protein
MRATAIARCVVQARSCGAPAERPLQASSFSACSPVSLVLGLLAVSLVLGLLAVSLVLGPLAVWLGRTVGSAF